MAKGYGELMLARLREVPHATTNELAELAGVPVKHAESRLYYLQHHDGRIKSVGKGAAKLWFLPECETPPEAPPPEAPKPPKQPELDALGFESKSGWKPSHRSFVPFDPITEVSVGDRLLIEYPERWRDSVAVFVRRVPDDKGVALCGFLDSSSSCYVDLKTFAARGWKVSRLSKQDAERLLG